MNSFERLYPMAVIFPDVGKVLALQIVLLPSQTPQLHLFKNSYTPVVGTLLSDLTEATFPGYAPINLTLGSTPTINGSDQGQYQWLANTWTCSTTFGGETEVGWYITIKDLTGTPQLFMVEKFSAGVLVMNSGDQVQFDLTLLDELGT